MTVNCSASPQDGNGFRRPLFSIPVVALVSGVGFAGSGMAWLFDRTAELEMDIRRNADRVEMVRAVSEVRSSHASDELRKVIALLEAVRATQGLIRDTQKDIRSTQKEIRAAQVLIIKELDKRARYGPSKFTPGKGTANQ